MLDEANDPYCLSDEAATELLAGAPWQRFATVGDSIAEGIGEPSPGYRTVPWADRIASILGGDYLNIGRMGSTTAEVVAEQLDRAIAFEPDLVAITCGANDIFAKDPDYAATEANLDRLFGAAAASGAQIFTMTVADVFRDTRLLPLRARLGTVNDIIRAVAARHGAVVAEFWQHPIRMRPDLMSSDNIHFRMSGHAVVAAEVVKVLAATLGADPAHPRGVVAFPAAGAPTGSGPDRRGATA